MADEAKVTPEAEKIAPKVETPKEGSVAAEIAKTEPDSKEKSKELETVPLSVYLALKDDVKELKREVKESKDSKKPGVIIEGVKDLAKKYPDVSEDFIQDILSSASSAAKLELDKEYTPKLQKIEAEKTKEAFDRAFDKVYDKAVSENSDLPKSIDKETIKALALTPQYRNTPISELLVKLYGEGTGKSASENEARTGADKIDDIVNFEKITPEQKKAILADPKARAKYFSYLDTLG